MGISLIQSNALRIPLANKKVHCVVTSPPYYGLRSYSGEQQTIIGGDNNCNHEWGEEKIVMRDSRSAEELLRATGLNVAKDRSKARSQTSNIGSVNKGAFCQECNAWRGAIGLEPTLQEYIDNMVLWCREIWRVLRDDGTFWLNCGDSYNGSGGAGGDYNPGGLKEGQPKYPGRNEIGLKPKDLMLVPHRVAIALQNDGWWVRSDIVWHKPNPMPESVTDRPTKSHEYIFLLAKSRNYYYDQDAIREPHQDPADIHRRIKKDGQYKHDKSRRGWMEGSEERANLAVSRGRNKRSVWTITTKPYKGAHFATFPPEIPEICIKAGTSEKGVCPVCGSQWARVVEKDVEYPDDYGNMGERGGKWVDEEKNSSGHRIQKNMNALRSMGRNHDNPFPDRTTTGWKPTCSCMPRPGEDCIACIGECDCTGEEPLYQPIPATVLDPFAGSATAIMVARQLGRNGIGIDLSWEYLQLARERTGEKAWKEWIEGRKAESGESLEELPLFNLQK